MGITAFVCYSIANEELNFYKTASYRGKNANNATVALRPKALTLVEELVTAGFQVRQEAGRKDSRKHATDDMQQLLDMIAEILICRDGYPRQSSHRPAVSIANAQQVTAHRVRVYDHAQGRNAVAQV